MKQTRARAHLYPEGIAPEPYIKSCEVLIATQSSCHGVYMYPPGGMCLRHTRLCRSQAPLDRNLGLHLPLRPASRNCHEICIHSPIYTSEYENGTPLGAADTLLHRHTSYHRGTGYERRDTQAGVTSSSFTVDCFIASAKGNH